MRKNKHKLLPIFGLMTLFIVVGSMIVAPLVFSLEDFKSTELVLEDTTLEKQSNEKESQEEEDTKDEKEEVFLLNFSQYNLASIKSNTIYSAQNYLMNFTLETHIPPPEQI
jgi:hypothetical protein|tara:strand:+ start:10096 stop:10428 length:333 start_codon:yes stop_codon:yes gene_type:complete